MSNINLVSPSCGIPLSLLIESIDSKNKEGLNLSRGALTPHVFDCVTATGVKFQTTMQGFTRDHAYKRLRGQTEGEILIAA